MQFPTYKRTSSRDHKETMDVEENSALFQNDTWQESTKPSWKRSLPHVLVATLSSFLFGYHLGVVNEPLESISLDLGFKGNTLAEGLVVSTCLGGAFIGSLLSGWVADGVGRCRAFQLCAFPMILGASISATTNTLHGMLLGRLLVGAGMGLGPPVAALYVAEISPAFVRGTYGSFIQIATCLGLMGALLVGIPVKDTVGWWRLCFWLSTIPAATLAIGMMLSAESPHWLYKQGRTSDAEAEFEKLLGGSHVHSAMMELEKSDRGDTETVKISELLWGRHSRGSISAVLSDESRNILMFIMVSLYAKDVLYSRTPFAVIFIGSTLFALQQLSGINAVFYFSSTVFRSAGVPSNLANVFVGISNLAGSLIAMALMDKMGRKLLLLWSFLGMAVSMGVQVSGASSFMPKSVALYLSVGGMLLLGKRGFTAPVYNNKPSGSHKSGVWGRFVFTFALGAGPVPALLLPEIFPSRIRAKAMAFCMCVHWVINFFVGLLFLRLLEQLGPQLLYTIFSSVCLMAVAFVKKNVIETKGKSLQEIEIALLPDE